MTHEQWQEWIEKSTKEAQEVVPNLAEVSANLLRASRFTRYHPPVEINPDVVVSGELEGPVGVGKSADNFMMLPEMDDD